jgi:hypothetical protein
MSEFSSRVDAQRTILKVVNGGPWQSEELFALNAKAIARWASVNHIDATARLVRLLSDASAQVFIMANHSDDPVAGAYPITKDRLDAIEAQLKQELEAGHYWETGAGK